MAKQDVSKDFIPGIYNFCDRWCEKCHLQARCQMYVFSGQPEASSDQVARLDWWEEMEETFQATLRYLEEWRLESALEKNPSLAPFGVQQGEEGYLQLARAYGLWVETYLNDAPFGEETPAGLSALHPPEAGEMLEVIRYYQHQIYVKVLRAKESRERYRDDREQEDSWLDDSLGSAKVALVEIHRSMAAWAALSDWFPGTQDDMLNGLILLERLKKALESAFPQAPGFLRPGLDTPPLPSD